MNHNPRLIAVKALDKIINRKVFLNNVLSLDLQYQKLPDQDKKFCSNLIITSLRFRGELNHLFNACLKNKNLDLPPLVSLTLLVGAAQIIHLRTPIHAAVNETVNLAKILEPDFANLVNAVLRRIESREQDILKNINRTKINVPNWLYGKIKKQYGKDKVDDICKSLLTPPCLDIWVKDKDKVDYYAQKLDADIIDPSQINPNFTSKSNILRLKEKSDITMLDGFLEGDWWVQDASSSLPICYLASEKDLNDLTILDMCSAPGSKTLQASSLGAKVTAIDISELRLKKLNENLERTNLKAEFKSEDSLNLNENTKYDVVLLDAPCSATGTIRKNPEILCIKDEEEVYEMVEIQSKLLNKAKSLVKKDGIIIYSTCSLLYEENQGLLKKCNLEYDKDFTILPSMLPDKGGLNGFIFFTIKASSFL